MQLRADRLSLFHGKQVDRQGRVGEAGEAGKDPVREGTWRGAARLAGRAGPTGTYLIDSRSRQVEAYCATKDTAQAVLQLLLGLAAVGARRHLAALLVGLEKVLGLVQVLANRRGGGRHRGRHARLLRDAARRGGLVARVRHVACFGVFP